jgi:hypothetical protein
LDFTLSTVSSADTAKGWVFGPQGVTCCSLKIKFLMEDKSTVPDFPSVQVRERRSNSGSRFSGNLNRRLSDESIPLTVPMNSTAEIAVEGLPAGYVLKSIVYGGKEFGLDPFKVDGQSLATVGLTLGYDLAATSKKVTARGRLSNPAPELNLTSIRFTSTMPNGPSVTASLQPDGSFEFRDIPVGAYRAGGVVGVRASATTVLVLRDDVAGLSIDMRDNPFPEFFDVRPERTAFTDVRSIDLTGVVTQRLTRTGVGDSKLHVQCKAVRRSQ